MFEFVKVKMEREFGVMEYGWMLKVTDIFQLIPVEKSKVEEVYKNIRDVAVGQEKSYRNRVADAVHTIAELKGESLVGVLSNFSAIVLRQQAEMIQKYGKIYINKNGGYMFGEGIIEVGESVKSEIFRFPIDKDK